VVAQNALGSAQSAPITVSVSDLAVAPSITTQPANLSVAAGSDAAFAIAAHGTEALSYQWRFNGTAITGANSPVLYLSAVTSANAGSYSVVVSNSAGDPVTSIAGTLSVSSGVPAADAPSIVTQPVAVTVNAGNTATFAVGVSGTGPFTYQWLKGGLPISGATAAFYSIASAAAGDAGSYAVQVTNSVNTANSTSATLTVNANPVITVVSITSQPSPQIQLPGGSATFAVAASGTGPLSYQWLKDGSPISGATSAVLLLSNLQVGDAAAYSVTVSNGLGGGVTSNAASLNVVGAPAITTQPTNVSASEGATATFSVSATGTNLRYQWTLNGGGIGGASSATYTTPTLSLADNGAVYGVFVYNGAGLVISNSAVLTVTPLVAPSFSTQPTDQGMVEPSTATFTAVVGGSPVPTLQWQMSTDGGSNWVDIAGATSTSYTTAATALADSGKQYRVVAINSAGPVVSAVATLTVTLATPPLSASLSAGKIAVGTFHACAVKADATAACWGHGSSHQVVPGGSSQDAWTPQVIPGLSGVTYVAAGQVESCAIDGTGTLWCWGGGRGLAAIKDGSGVNYTGVKAVAMGLMHSCFIDAGTTVRCWGNNGGGQLGADPALTGTGYVTTPVFVNRYNSIPLTGVVSLSADGDGNNTCALTSAGEVVCWGNGNFVALPVVTGATAMRNGSGHGCAVMAAGGMKCWGANGAGQLGNRNTTASAVAVNVIDLPGLLVGVTSIATQSTNTCVIPATGRVVCWGAVDPDRMNGNNTFGPTEKGNLAQRVVALSSGRAQTCALVVDGSLECWGSNEFGQLGVGTINAINSGGPNPPSSTVIGGAIFWH
jgi:alpha-tubulin suppressor-like RCC1 family protein